MSRHPTHGSIATFLISPILLALLPLVACSAGSSGQDTSELLLRSYQLPPDVDQPTATSISQYLNSLVGEQGEVRRLPGTMTLAVTAPASFHDGVESVIASIAAGGAAEDAPAPAVSIDCWVVIARVAGRTPGDAAAVPTEVHDALSKATAAYGAYEFQLIDSARLSSLAHGQEAGIDGHRLLMQQRVIAVDNGIAVADLKLRVLKGNERTRNILETRVKLAPAPGTGQDSFRARASFRSSSAELMP